MAGIALINGQNIAHQDIVFPIGGVPIVSLSDLTIDESREGGFSYGTQKEPVGYGRGKENPVDLTFTISKKDHDSLRAASPGRKVTNLPLFDIPFTTINIEAPRFDIIKNVMVLSTSYSSDEDTTDAKVQYTCIASSLENKY